MLTIQITNGTAPEKTLLLNISRPGGFTERPDGGVLKPNDGTANSAVFLFTK